MAKAKGWQIMLLSGDSSPMVAEVARQLGIKDARGGLPPEAKLDVLKQLHSEGRRVLMLGDGVNDVPVLAAADISIAMGSATDLAKTSADAVLPGTGITHGATNPPDYHREPDLGQSVQWPSTALRSHWLDHANLRRTGHVRQLIVGGIECLAANPPVGWITRHRSTTA